MKILNVVGARPNFMKMAPLMRVLREDSSFQCILIHTGQHYDTKMSDVFFHDLDLPEPDIHLNAGAGSHARQTADIMVRFEKVVEEQHPDLVVVVGDVNSTLACSVTASKMHVPVAHVEAGLRSFDRTMPEEINRVVTDAVSDVLFTTERSGDRNLLNEGKRPDQIHFVGNVMIDSLKFALERMDEQPVLRRYDLTERGYAVVTLHRPSNVDDPRNLHTVISMLDILQQRLRTVFPIHPRSLKMMEAFGYGEMLRRMANLIVSEPMGYMEFLSLVRKSRLVVTDSGGLQEETTCMGIPCLTMRSNTERPVTIEQGTNVLVGLDKSLLAVQLEQILNDQFKKGSVPELWDGHAASRIVHVLKTMES